jgi:hypothetical protein
VPTLRERQKNCGKGRRWCGVGDGNVSAVTEGDIVLDLCENILLTGMGRDREEGDGRHNIARRSFADQVRPSSSINTHIKLSRRGCFTTNVQSDHRCSFSQ